jgi:hypothetical protein
MSKAHGFSFSHTMGMGEVLLKSPLSSLLSRGLRPGSRIGGGNSKSYRFGWGSTRSSSPTHQNATSQGNVTSPPTGPSSTTSSTSPIERTTRISINEPIPRKISNAARPLVNLLAPILPKSKSARDMTPAMAAGPSTMQKSAQSKSQVDVPVRDPAPKSAPQSDDVRSGPELKDEEKPQE